MNRWEILFAAWLLLIGPSAWPQQAVTATPQQAATATPRIYTSTRQVTGLAAAPDGSVWVATTGGVCQILPNGTQRKFTRLDGLPSHEARHIAIRDGSIVVTFPTTTAVWKAEQWHSEPIPITPTGIQPTPRAATPEIPEYRTPNTEHRTPEHLIPEHRNTLPLICETWWRGRRYAATARGLAVQQGTEWQDIPLPPSTGTHVSALLARRASRDNLVAALFGDGLWQYDGKAWQPLAIHLPPETRDITALAEQGTALWIGTRRAGVWRLQAGKWQSYLRTDEPFNTDCQALAVYAGQLFCSSLEDGLAVQTQATSEWRHETTPTLSFHAPRQMAVFQNRLYLRQTDGKVDCFDGKTWERNVFAGIPREEVTALAADGEHLYIAQWGGWSVWNGRQWAHHLDNPDLQSIALTCLQPEGNTLWIGTQGKGVVKVNLATQTLRRHDERHGLPDDWITCLLRAGQSLYAGTFVGGPATWDGAKWNTNLQLDRTSVTALAEDPRGGVWIGTRTGLWQLSADGVLTCLNTRLPWLDTEAQSLCADSNGLWIGTRTSLTFLPYPQHINATLR